MKTMIKQQNNSAEIFSYHVLPLQIEAENNSSLEKKNICTEENNKIFHLCNDKHSSCAELCKANNDNLMEVKEKM